MNHTKLLQSALESMRGYRREHGDAQPCDTERAIEAALAQQVAEPVAWMVRNGVCDYQLFWSKNQAEALADEMQKRHDLSGSLAAFHVQPLYTHPAAGGAGGHARHHPTSQLEAAHGITGNKGD